MKVWPIMIEFKEGWMIAGVSVTGARVACMVDMAKPVGGHQTT